MGGAERDPFVPDVRDLRGRLRRGAIAALVAMGLAVIALVITTTLARHDLVEPRTTGAYRFVAYFTLGAWVVGFLATRAWLQRRDRVRERELPTAKARVASDQNGMSSSGLPPP